MCYYDWQREPSTYHTVVRANGVETAELANAQQELMLEIIQRKIKEKRFAAELATVKAQLESTKNQLQVEIDNRARIWALSANREKLLRGRVKDLEERPFDLCPPEIRRGVAYGLKLHALNLSPRRSMKNGVETWEIEFRGPPENLPVFGAKVSQAWFVIESSSISCFARVIEVTKDSAAFRSGIRENDLIVCEPPLWILSPADLETALKRCGQIDVTCYRAGTFIKLTVRVKP